MFIDDPTGAIFAVKADTNPDNWNFFVSARALGLLCKTYEGMKAHMENVLTSMGAQIKAAHINRIDYAIDIATTNFELDMRNFVARSAPKIQPYFSTDQDLDEYGDKVSNSDEHHIGAIMRGGRFESVTIGKFQYFPLNRTSDMACLSERRKGPASPFKTRHTASFCIGTNAQGAHGHVKIAGLWEHEQLVCFSRA